MTEPAGSAASAKADRLPSQAGSEILYAVDDLNVSQAQLAYKITESLQSEGISDAELGIVLLLRVPAELSELVEATAHNNGVKLTPVRPQ